MKYVSSLFILLTLFILTACRKEPDTVKFSGQLLLSKKNPIPISNRRIEIYQRGNSPAIGMNSGSTSAEAYGQTNTNGFFELNFKPGKTFFIEFSSNNNNPLTLQNAWNDYTFPEFSRSNFPDSAYDPLKPIYIGKIIDTAIIKTALLTNLNISDTIGLQISTIDSILDKEYFGLTANQGSTITIDTLYNVFFTTFDCATQKFTNTIYAGRKWTTVLGYKTISSVGFPTPYYMSGEDEGKATITFYYSK